MSIRLPHPFNKFQNAARVVTMSKRTMAIIRSIETLKAEARLLARVAEQESKSAVKIAKDELKLAGGGGTSKLSLPPSRGHSPIGQAAPPKGKPAPPRPGAPAKPAAPQGARPAAGQGPLAQAAAKALKELDELRADFKDAVAHAERYRRDKKLLDKVTNQLKFNSAYNRLLRAQQKFNNAYQAMRASPHTAGNALATARREMEAAFSDMMSAVD
ncbi:MAG: hypothetical protein JWN21_1823 [Sphingomonas bacterium]|uniref:hypothetical protein n=1 Tax=Sphingomonas bacterium TaxID=1895847 RepID=UPI00260ED9DC|nr:hypothetical protein [Sphingomonas bacterium]MDB5696280.1 hypothetical protein [Sphingomonas bacterium]